VGRSRNSALFTLFCVLICLGGGIAGYTLAGRFTPVAPPAISYQVTPSPNSVQAQSTTASATQTAVNILALKGRTLYEDPKVTSASQEDTDTHTITNTEKGLLLTVKQPDRKAWMLSETDLPSDMDVSVTAQGMPPDPCDGWAYSLDIRQQIDYDQRTSVPFYDFEIYHNFTWRLGWYDGDQADSRTIASGDIDKTFNIHQPNTLRVVAIGKHFDLYINDKEVGSADDPDGQIYPQNHVGVAIETCSNSVTALFTNLVVKAPQ